MAASSKGAVVGALAGNGALTLVKGVAFLASGSGAMLSEAIHSAADTANQFLLFVGMRRSERAADTLFHYGYGGERYLYALLSAVGIFVLGCGVTVYHGVHNLLDPPTLTFSWLTIGVLGVSFLVEGAVFLGALRAASAKKGDHSLLGYLRSTTDPTVAAVLLEDAVACLGVLVAAAGILLSRWTGDPTWDALGAITIGLLLGVVAVWLGIKNRTLLLGPSIPKPEQAAMRALLLEQDTVLGVRQVRSRILGADVFRFDAEIDFDGRALARRVLARAESEGGSIDLDPEELGERVVDELGREIDRLEALLRERHPGLAHVDLEAD